MVIPVVLFVHKRVDTLLQVLEGIQYQSLPVSRLIIFSDAARNTTETADIQFIRDTIRTIDWADIEVIERNENFGGAKNIITGITQVFKNYDRAVVLEDDTYPTPYFYESMSFLLDHYQSESRIFSVSGYPSLKSDALPNYAYDVILSPRFSIWGWGTWADRWSKVQADLHNFANPFTSLEEVPDTAGSDLRHIAQLSSQYVGRYFWTGSALALISLYHGWRHAHTRYYLIQNIGRNTGQNAKNYDIKQTKAFFDAHTKIINQVPKHVPEFAIISEVDIAVQTYVREVHAALRQDSQKQPTYKNLYSKFLKFLRRGGIKW